jgi:hypothetical protein
MSHVNPIVMLVSPLSARPTHLDHSVLLRQPLAERLSIEAIGWPLLAGAFVGHNITYND